MILLQRGETNMRSPRTSWMATVAAGAVLSSGAMAQSASTFSKVVQPYVDQGRFAGAVTVVASKAGATIRSVVGYADVEAKKPMRRDTLFWLASTSKAFQSTALMMLVDDGKVALDDPVSKYLPAFDHAPFQSITIRMLLNHTNGLSYFDPAHPERTDCCSLQEMVEKFASRPLMFEPGTRFGYSNAGPDTSSRIVEVVSGQDFETFLGSRLLEPLGMTDTTYFPNDEQVSRLAVTYMSAPDNKMARAPNEVFLTAPYGNRSVRHAPGGGLFSTADDLAKYARMMLRKGELGGRRYLSETAIAEMTRDQIPAALASGVPQPPGPASGHFSYGLGWGISPTGAYFHIGVTMTDIRVDPAHGIATIFLTQHAPDPTSFEVYFKIIDASLRNAESRER